MVSTGNGDTGGASRITAEVAKVLAQLPPVVESLTGLKLEHLLEKVRTATAPPVETAVDVEPKPPARRG
jgi:flotillin